MILQAECSDHSEMRSLHAKLAYLTFCLFFFFVIFGTDMPFREQSGGVEDIPVSSQLRQAIYTVLLGMALVALAPKRAQLWRLLCTDKWLMCFLLWCGLSILWSEFPFVSFKRYLQVLIALVVIATFLIHCRSLKPAFRILQRLIGCYLVLCAMAIVLIPAAIEPEGHWRGLTHGKNSLGQFSLIGLLLWSNGLRKAPDARRSVIFGMMGLAGLLLLGSRSMTALLATALIGTMALVEWLIRRLGTVGMGHTFVSWMLVWGLALILVLYVEPGVVDGLLNFLGKDATFTDRTRLWEAVIDEAKQHWLFGGGFDGFWVVEHKTVLHLYATDFIWLPNQAHNGYLDLWNEIGVIGLGLFIGLVLCYFRHVRHYAQAYDGRWLYLGTLVINLMESTFFRLSNITGILFAFAYLAVCVERMLTQEQESVPRQMYTYTKTKVWGN